jgi:hypothetical protein
MGYIFSFFLGIFVATVGVNGITVALNKTLQQTQTYIKESVKK